MGSSVEVVLFLHIIRIIEEIRTLFFSNHAESKRPAIGVRISEQESSRFIGKIYRFVNILIMLVGLEI